MAQSQTQTQIPNPKPEQRYCIRIRDEWGNRHDSVADIPDGIAEIIERGRTDEYRKIFVLHSTSVRVVSITKTDWGKETYCTEYDIGINEACEEIKNAMKIKSIRVLLEPDIDKLCPTLCPT